MSLDTKHRPSHYSGVLGQDAIVRIIRRFVADGKGFRQSYLFSGPFGSGKTTLGRILARALLCQNPTLDGDPCDQCPSCRSFLETGTSVDFIEVDAATNSGKAEMLKIAEEIAYDTYSGKRKVYLFDESHQLSRDALDAMLKPLEENVPGTDDKRLVCIFCTTEPEKMRATILSRCAPAFVIQAVTPSVLAARLAEVCTAEGIQFDPEVLPLIAESTECHFRDALKAVEGISLLGPLSRENVSTYLRLDLHMAYLGVLENLGRDLGAALAAARKVLERASPQTCYERLAELSMTAYQVFLGATQPPIYLDAARVTALGTDKTHLLLAYAARFADRPGRPTPSMLFCDLGSLHHGGFAGSGGPVIVVNSGGAPAVPATPGEAAPGQPPPSEEAAAKAIVTPPPETLRQPKKGRGMVQVDPRAVAAPQTSVLKSSEPEVKLPGSPEYSAAEFARALGRAVLELDGGGGPTRQPDMDRGRVDSAGGGQG